MIRNYSRDINPIKLIFSEHPSFISTSSIKFDHMKLGAFFFLHAWFILWVSSNWIQRTFDKRCAEIPLERSTKLHWHFFCSLWYCFLIKKKCSFWFKIPRTFLFSSRWQLLSSVLEIPSAQARCRTLKFWKPPIQFKILRTFYIHFHGVLLFYFISQSKF